MGSRSHEDPDTGRRPGRAHGGLPLSREPANEVTVVDTNEDVLRDLQDRLDVRAVAGNGSYPTVLEAPASPTPTSWWRSPTAMRSISSPARSRTLLYRTPTKIARIRAPEYTSREQLFTEGALAVDVWISPEQLVTEYIARLLSLSGRAAGRGLRQRPRAAGGRARAPRGPAGGQASCARCASTCPGHRGARRRHLSQRSAASRPRATP